MNRLACGEEHEGRIRLFRPDGAPLESSADFDAILVSRLDCDVRFVELPPVSEHDLEGLLKYRLRSIYPGDPDDTVLDFRIIGEGSERRAMLLIVKRSILELYRSLAGSRRLLLPFELVERLARGREAVRIWFCMDGWQELLVYRRGRLESSSAYRRDGRDAGALIRLEETLVQEIREMPALCVAMAGAPLELPEGMSAVPTAALADVLRRATGVFQPRRKRARVLSSGVRAFALSVAAVVLGVLVFYRYVAVAERHAEALRSAGAALEVESGRVLAIQREIEELEGSVARLVARRPQDVYAALSAIGEVLGEKAVISTLVIRGDAFQVEAVGSNSLLLMERFRTHAQFRDVKLSQVFPDPSSGEERFSFSGSFRAR